MQRQPIDNGKWFDIDRATRIQEGQDHDGNNYISMATGSQWDHEALFLTRSNKWVLNCWSCRQGDVQSFTEISAREAAIWLVKNCKDQPTLNNEIASLEI